MTERERLIDLLEKSFHECETGDYETVSSSEIADYLLKNGIIVPPCI